MAHDGDLVMVMEMEMAMVAARMTQATLRLSALKGQGFFPDATAFFPFWASDRILLNVAEIWSEVHHLKVCVGVCLNSIIESSCRCTMWWETTLFEPG